MTIRNLPILDIQVFKLTVLHSSFVYFEIELVYGEATFALPLPLGLERASRYDEPYVVYAHWVPHHSSVFS